MLDLIKEAFRELNLLKEEAFDLDDEKDIEELGKFVDEDSLDGIEMVVDADTFEEDELQDSYVGKVLLWCPICHTVHYADEDSIVVEEKDEIEDIEGQELQEEETLVNIEEVCPECHEKGQGFVVKGKVAAYDEEKVEKPEEEKLPKEETELKIEDEEEIKEESLKESLKTKKQTKKEFTDNFSLLESLMEGDLGKDVDFVEVEKEEEFEDDLSNLEEEKGLTRKLGRKFARREESLDDIDAKKDNKKELAKKKYQKAVDDADADRDDEVKELKESDKPAATSMEDCQKWVDYDMKHYGKISKRTNELVKKAGFQILKDDHGDYEVGAGKYNESLKEDTVKQGNAWVNKGKEGIHGKFKTKKEADAQRKAMFAQGYKEELKESQEDYYVLSDGKNPRKSRVYSEIEVDDFIAKLEKNKEGKPYHELVHFVKGQPVKIWTSEKGKIEESINLKEEPIYDLSPEFDSRKSFYGKARVEVRDDGSQILWSYSTPVAFVSKDGKEAKLLTRGYYGWASSQTTLRHVKDFLKQNGFAAGSSRDLAKNYEVVDYYDLNRSSKEESLEESKQLNEGTSNFGRLEYFPLLVFDDFLNFIEGLKYLDDFPTLENFRLTDENGHFYYDEEAFEDARDEFEQKAMENYDYPLIEVDELNSDLDEFNDETMHIAYSLDSTEDADLLEDIKLRVEPGYYEGAYIDVEKEEYLDDLSDEVREEQLKRFSDFFKEMKKKYGLVQLNRLGTFSNGESVYTKVEDEEIEESKKCKHELKDCSKEECKDEEFEELDEALFDSLVNKYCNRVYENVAEYKTTDGTIDKNNLVLEGILTYKSGKQVNTKFVFENIGKTKTGLIKLQGINETFTNNKKAFTLTAKTNEKKLMSEGLSYSYKVKVNEEEKTLKGRVTSNKR